MKRLIWLTAVFLMLFTSALPAMAQSGGEITVSIDGLPVAFDVNPVIDNNRTLVPFRALAEALNVQVTWDQKTRTIVGADGKNTITLQIGSKTALRNGMAIPLDMPPRVLNGKTLIPLRFFSEAFACQVAWSPAENKIKILSPPREMTVIGFYALGDRQTSSWTNLFGKPFPDAGVGNTDVVNTVALGWYSLDRQGNLLTKSSTGWQRPDDYEKVLDKAEEFGLKTQMVLHMTDGDGSLTNLLANEIAMRKAVAAIIEEAKNYQGVHLDFEGLGRQDKGEGLTRVRDSFSNFVNLLSQPLKAANLPLTLTLHAPNSAYQGYDYKKLGQMADEIIIMAHDYGVKPEPVDLVTQAVKWASQMMPPEKLILGISVPSETPESLVTKVGIAKRYQLKGISLWRLGLVSEEMWTSLRTCVVTRKQKT
ncbi:stalk domain-containing protein [Desulforamulus putei]|uniref:stalk domain-containing protein n=1 Tax=Desulforamulus putei TaxID=74701 RepID=UPI002FDD5468